MSVLTQRRTCHCRVCWVYEGHKLNKRFVYRLTQRIEKVLPNHLDCLSRHRQLSSGWVVIKELNISMTVCETTFTFPGILGLFFAHHHAFFISSKALWRRLKQVNFWCVIFKVKIYITDVICVLVELVEVFQHFSIYFCSWTNSEVLVSVFFFYGVVR